MDVLLYVLWLAYHTYHVQGIKYSLCSLNTPGLIQLWGYPVENHIVHTNDGYSLMLFRIPHSKDMFVSSIKKVVLIQHGYNMSSDNFIYKSPEQDLGYILADAGCDVWLGNFRGNYYSGGQDHDVENKTYWNFSFHEMGVYDLPAMIDYILYQTGQQQLYVVAYSMGSVASFVCASSLPECNEKVKAFLLLSPTAYLQNVNRTDPLEVLFFRGFARAQELDNNGNYGFGQRFLSQVAAVNAACGEGSSMREDCIQQYLQQPGFDPNELDTEFIVPVKACISPVSTKTGIHIVQITDSGIFRQFDYGTAENLRIYNQSEPPRYYLSNVTTLVALYKGSKDAVTDDIDFDKMYSELPNAERFDVPYDNYQHYDFYLNKDNKCLLYDSMVEYIQNH